MMSHTRREFLKKSLVGGAVLAGPSYLTGIRKSENQSGDIQVACYYFPNYHVDPRNEAQHGTGWTEWDLVKHATPRFSGHQQPKVPQWGYADEADPEVMAFKINTAADHGIDAFIYDWYWYDDGPFLQRGLESGFLKASNNNKVQFALMWANHTWLDIHPHKLHTTPPELYPGPVKPETFQTLTDYIIAEYFRHPSYWQINGEPCFSIYSLTDVMQGFGSVEATRNALSEFRRKTRDAGFRDLHLNAVVWGQQILPGEKTPTDPNRLITELRFDSFTSYVWIHHVRLQDFPATDCREVRDGYLQYYDHAEQDFTLPYIPNVTMGWDSSPRTVQSDRFVNAGYPFMPVMVNNSPEEFHRSLKTVADRVQQRETGPRIFNINCWNEWTEGSYLEPDIEHGLGYLEAIKDIKRTL